MHPEQGFEGCPDDRKEEAGKEPTHHLGVYMMFAGLPIGIYPKTAQYATDGTEDKY